ncbi:hypothetical protein [Anabaena catenula]|uniref:Uncharacterized protein n=1 Tax=Anabaena catenula FACHB-362 TaxID=2692877 RepID=A0ABR8J531_9NOST|nr:hypothetical protein [Anabaena catenula]MBD2692592.1 hypothetical protein [Anabaena catenula FACHB-362]
MSQDNRRKQRNEAKTQPSQQEYQINQPIWKTTIIQILRGTIGVLETTVENLETEQTLTAEKKPNFLQRILSGWDGFLRTFRLFLPSNISNNLSDTVLTGIFAVITVGIVGTTAFLFTSKPVEVATLPSVEEVPAPIPTVTASPEPIPTTIPEPIPEPTIIPEPEPAPTEEPEPEPTPTPTPIIELTPEQALIAAIENQFSEISIPLTRSASENISSKLIKSIQANFRTSDLTIKISDVWYDLEKSQQDKLAADIFQRSQELDFSHLEIIDFQDKLVARSPVVGNQMLIFKR